MKQRIQRKLEAPYILGISGSHNGAACILDRHGVVVAVQEERLVGTKRKRIYGAESSLCISYCLEASGLQPEDLDMVVVAPQKVWRNEHDPRQNSLLRVERNSLKTEVISHHYAHAVYAFATSGFVDSVVIVVDGIGSHAKDLASWERSSCETAGADLHETISLYEASETGFTVLRKEFCRGESWLERIAWLGSECPRMPRFNSLGGMYAAVATQIFGNMDDAGKVMGLAPYGESVYPVEDFYVIEGGKFVYGLTVSERFGFGDRWPSRRAQYQDLAASVQSALNQAMLEIVKRARKLSGLNNLCLTGGVALNGITNELLMRSGIFDDIHIAPAAEDNGTAIGAAYHGLWRLLGRPKKQTRISSDSLAASYTEEEILTAIESTPEVVVVEKVPDVVDRTVDLLCKGGIVGWFQGGSEFGPRALGHRSILCDPRREDARDVLNLRIKDRESFRPFAPAILAEMARDWFEIESRHADSPFMLRVIFWRRKIRDRIPAVVHVDGSGRPQTVTEATNGVFYQLIHRFWQRTGVPLLLNTSFNMRGEPIVETPEDALWVSFTIGLDACVIENFVVKPKVDSGLLNLVPYLNENYRLESGLLTLGEVDRGFRVTRGTRWGDCVRELEPECLRVMRFINGKRNGMSILRHLQNHGFELSEIELKHTLNLLRYYSVISFRGRIHKKEVYAG